MESAQNLKRRMRSVQNIGQITKAMELVAATKMRRSQELALNSRPYAYTALEILGIIAGLKDVPMPELLAGRPERSGGDKVAFVIVTSDKGLAGSFNSSVFRKFENYVRTNKINLHEKAEDGTPRYSFIVVGQKAKSYLEHRGFNVARAFLRVGDFTRIEEVNPISEALIVGYLTEDFDRVVSFSTQFITALRQDVLVRDLLPISREKIEESITMLVPESGRFSKYLNPDSLTTSKDIEYIIEPSPKEVLKELANELLKIRLYHMVLEANASEHSARRVAMKNASDNASELSGNLNIEYNKSRQAAITRELTEITAGADALQK